ncbi:MAG: dihydropteroate synthase [Phycisphaerales bacterium]
MSNFAMREKIENRKSKIENPIIVGILNLTPDSFSDGGRHADTDAAVSAAHRMIADGADILDLGGESTRPGAGRIDADEQIRRVIPVIEQIRSKPTPSGRGVRLSIDTTLTAVARAALDAGATIINDISAGLDPRNDVPMFQLAAERDVPIVLMHMLGEPATMQADPRYTNVVTEVREFLLRRAGAALAAGVKKENIILDPGLGFGKTTEHNLRLLAHLGDFVNAGYPVLLGASRKRFLGEITGVADPAQRVAATCAATVIGVMAGVRYFRVHDVAENRHAADVTFSVLARP